MSKKDYSKYSNKHNKPESNIEIQNGVSNEMNLVEEVAEVVVDEVAVNEVAVNEVADNDVVVSDVVEETKAVEPKIKFGVVVDCARLNVRSRPSANADVICVLEKDTEIEVCADANVTFYKICTAAGVDGFCMKKFIKVR